MSQHNFANNRFVPASSLSLGSSGIGASNNNSTTTNGPISRRSSFYSNSAMMANNNNNNNNSSSGVATSSFSKPNGSMTSSLGSTNGPQPLFSHANRRESFGAPTRITPGGLGVSQLIHHGHNNNNTTTSTTTIGDRQGSNSYGLMNGVSGTINNNNTSMNNVSMERNQHNVVNSNIMNSNRNSLSGSFSQQNRVKRTINSSTMLPPRPNTFHNILGTSHKDDVLSPEETCKTNPLDEALVKENAELKKENDDLKQQLQKLKAQLVEKEKEMVDKEDKLKKAQFASKEVSDCKEFIENMSLKLIELGVDPNTLKQHPSSTLSYDLSNILIGSSIELDDSVRELENVLFKYSPLYSKTSTLMQLED